MRNIKLTLEYDGTGYRGWQVQPSGARTIQAAIEKALKKILRKKISITASGRTDSGVHALAQVANFITDSEISLDRLQRGLNGILPGDIAISRIEEVSLGFHSRFCAKSKLYRYIILCRPYPSPILKDSVYFCRYPLDVRLMQKEAKALLGRHNFTAFAAANKKKINPVKTIKKLKITKDAGFIYIDIEADGFLYNMVRNIVGTLIEIARGRLPEGSLKKILLSRNRGLAGPTISPKGLYLAKVNY